MALFSKLDRSDIKSEFRVSLVTEAFYFKKIDRFLFIVKKFG